MLRSRLFLIPAVVLLAAACDAGEPGRMERPGTPQNVTVSVPATTASARQIPARVVATEEAQLATRTSGTVRSVLVDVGAHVRAGQPLARLDETDVEAGVASAEARLQVARKTYERIRALERDGAATAQELDQVEAELRMAEAGAAQARAQRDYVVLKAPFAGTITRRLVDPGDLAVPGQPVLAIAGSGGVKVEADAPAPLADQVDVGAAVRVVDPPTGRSWPATVTRRVPVIDATSNRFRLEAAFAASDAGLPLPGSYVRLEVETGVSAAELWIPADALVRQGQLTGVYVLENDVLRLDWIRLGREREGAMEVLAGLEPDAEVVREPAPDFFDGLAVGEVTRTEWSPVPATPEETR